MRLTAIVTLLTLLLVPCLVQADDCVYRDGGYCVSLIADQTAKRLGVKSKPIVFGESEWGDTVWMNKGTAYLKYYENIWDQMVKDEKVTVKDHEKAFEEAKKAGGTKIGGVNLVVLAARTLQKLVDLELLTLSEAQEILNKAKTGEK